MEIIYTRMKCNAGIGTPNWFTSSFCIFLSAFAAAELPAVPSARRRDFGIRGD